MSTIAYKSLSMVPLNNQYFTSTTHNKDNNKDMTTALDRQTDNTLNTTHWVSEAPDLQLPLQLSVGPSLRPHPAKGTLLVLLPDLSQSGEVAVASLRHAVQDVGEEGHHAQLLLAALLQDLLAGQLRGREGLTSKWHCSSFSLVWSL